MTSQPDDGRPGSRPDRARVVEHPRWWFWVGACAAAILVSGLIAFVGGQGLDRADKYSSIIAALVAIGGLTGTGLSWLWRRQRPSHAHHSPWGASEAEIVNEVCPPSELPAWPEYFDGYRFLREESASVRVFGGQGLATVVDFPATMNGCAHQRFFVRWRALGGQSVAASLVSAPDRITVESAAYGSAGWMSSHGCGQPAWELLHDDSSSIDVQLTWQVWIPAA